MNFIGGPDGYDTEADGINTAGQMVGYSTVSDFTYHAFLDEGGNVSDLGTLPGQRTKAPSQSTLSAKSQVGRATIRFCIAME